MNNTDLEPDITPNFQNKTGITVSELKKIVNNWPETNNYGDSTEVWIETGAGLSSQCVGIDPLNWRTENGVEWADLFLKSNS